jgi:hypothetical protein
MITGMPKRILVFRKWRVSRLFRITLVYRRYKSATFSEAVYAPGACQAARISLESVSQQIPGANHTKMIVPLRLETCIADTLVLCEKVYYLRAEGETRPRAILLIHRPCLQMGSSHQAVLRWRASNRDIVVIKIARIGYFLMLRSRSGQL